MVIDEIINVHETSAVRATAYFAIAHDHLCVEMGRSMGRLQGKTVLLVEDEPIVAMLVEDMLAGLGAQVVGPAAQLTEAIDLATSAQFDVAVLDVKLGGDSSAKVAEMLRERAIPYVLATGFDNPALGSGAPVLQKPYLQEDLERVLEQALENSEANRRAAHG